MTTKQDIPEGVPSSDLPPKREGKLVRHDESKSLRSLLGFSKGRVVQLLALLWIVPYACESKNGVSFSLKVGSSSLKVGTEVRNGVKCGYDIGADAGAKADFTNLDGPTKKAVLKGLTLAVAQVMELEPKDVTSALSGAVHGAAASASASSVSSSVSEFASSVGAAPTAAQAVFGSQSDTKSGKTINVKLKYSVH